MAISLFVLGRIRGVLRPGLITAVPSVTGEPFYFIDVGAVADCVPENILQFARMGQVYCSLVTGKETPTVGLLNIGEEAEKGSRQLIEAHKLLAAKAAGFIGNVEPKDAFGMPRTSWSATGSPATSSSRPWRVRQKRCLA